MHNKIYPIYKREMGSYFYSSIAYIFLILFVFTKRKWFCYIILEINAGIRYNCNRAIFF
mgnify:CR=1 FL=1